MNYSDIISLNDCFHPVCDLQAEQDDYWKNFIPNDVFEEHLLDAVLKSNGDNPQDRKAVWVRGTFGSGKSHASSVIKHLLCDDLEKIQPWVDKALNPRNRARVKQYKASRNNYLPVVLKGVERITDAQTFAWAIQSSIAKALSESLGEYALEDEFALYLSKLDDPSINWDGIIETNDSLRIHVSDTKQLRAALQSKDFAVLVALVKTLSEKNIHFSISSLSLPQWIRTATRLAKERGHAGILLIWDEFTSILDRAASSIVNPLQNIAELSAETDFILYLISHRTESYGRSRNDEFSKLDDRFYIVHYNMESSTSYHILSKAILLSDAKEHETYLSHVLSKNPELDALTTLLTREEPKSKQAKDELLRLLPLHPYTTFLCAMMSRNLGSSSRSIFRFLYDEKYGFKGFLLRETGIDRLCTADTLWDFFLDDLKKSEDITSILLCYNQHAEKLAEKGKDYLAVFKAILLLNALSQRLIATRTGYIAPKRDNILSIFAASLSKESVAAILDYISDAQIVYQDPFKEFKIDTSQLSQQEIITETASLRKNGIDLAALLSEQQKRDIECSFSSTRQPIRYTYLDGNLDSAKSKNEAKRALEKVTLGPVIHLLIFFCSTDGQVRSLHNHVKEFYLSHAVKENVIILSLSTSLTEKEEDAIYRYWASANVAQRHNRSDLSQSYESSKLQVFSDWLVHAKLGTCTVFKSLDCSSEIPFANAPNQISDYAARDLYNCSFISFPCTQATWKATNSPNMVEAVLKSKSGSELLSQFSGLDHVLRKIFQDTSGNDIICSDSLQFREDCPPTHPLKLITSQVTDLLKQAEASSEFNIALALKKLTLPPYGIFRCKVYQAVLAFALSYNLSNRTLYKAATGEVVLYPTDLRDIIKLIFEEWEGKLVNSLQANSRLKLNLRFASVEENELKSCIMQMFDIEEADSLDSLLSSIRFAFQEQKGAPLWVLLPEDGTSPLFSAMKSLFDFIAEPKYDVASIVSCLRQVKLFIADISELVNLPAEDYRRYFHRWLIRENKGFVDDNNVQTLHDYLLKHLAKEPSSWTALHIQTATKEWAFSMNSKTSRTEGADTNVSGEHGLIADEDDEIPSLDELNMLCSKLDDPGAYSRELLLLLIRDIIRTVPGAVSVVEKFTSHHD